MLCYRDTISRSGNSSSPRLVPIESSHQKACLDSIGFEQPDNAMRVGKRMNRTFPQSGGYGLDVLCFLGFTVKQATIWLEFCVTCLDSVWNFCIHRISINCPHDDVSWNSSHATCSILWRFSTPWVGNSHRKQTPNNSWQVWIVMLRKSYEL